MPWGSVTITYGPTGYTQNYKRDNVVTHPQCQAMVDAAVRDSVKLIQENPPAGGLPGPVIVNRNNIRQNMAAEPGEHYREI